MATLAELRQRIYDLPRYKYDTKTADGSATKYQVSDYPIQPASETIAVAGSVYGTSGYTMNGTSGLVTFADAPANNAQIVAEYTCTQIDGTTLGDILTRNSSVLDLAAAEALEMRAADAASFFSFISGADIKVDKTKVADNYMKLAEQLRSNYYNPDRQEVIDTQVEWTYMDTEQTGD